MSRWVKQGKWNSIKTSITITREAELSRFYQQLREIDDNISGREKGERFPSSKEADIISKLASAIEKLERDVGVAEIVNVARIMLEWLRPFDLEKAKEVSGLFDAFIKYVAK
jgi:hypothetical protein